MRPFLTLAALLAGLLAGCATQPPYQRPVFDVPANWSALKSIPPGGSPTAADEWWTRFDAPGLTELETRVLAANLDLQAAMRRVAQARATTRIVAADRYPFFTGDIRQERARVLAAGAPTANITTANLAAGFEPDLWERISNLVRAAEAAADAALESERAVKLTLAAEAATAFFSLSALDQRIDLVRRSIATAERVDGIVQARYRSGAVSGLDRAQSGTSLANIRASLPPLLQEREETLHALAILAGEVPGSFGVATRALMDIPLPERPPAGLPSELLQRRPDIRLAEANLRAAHADLGAARANLYPRLLLTADTGFASSQLATLLQGSSATLTVGAALLAPIFQGDRLQALSDRAVERYEELVRQYHQTVLSALRDVENALVALERAAEREAAQSEEIVHARRAYELAQIRYESGLTDAINLLSAQSALLGSENAFIQTRQARFGALVGLYKALGGGV